MSGGKRLFNALNVVTLLLPSPSSPRLYSTVHIAPLPAAQDKYLSTLKLRSCDGVSCLVVVSPSGYMEIERKAFSRAELVSENFVNLLRFFLHICSIKIL